ncbi:hypothetical protein Ciccas_002788 [Cichlidogyrus casuarinus]|uniref:Uncharacterized protein n=1 Tax=Cichlidogyrus casuarinus TaxID=1844966 RepID=A0ABD2QGU9_9PLAT
MFCRSKDVLLDYGHSANFAGILLLFYAGMNLIFARNDTQARLADLDKLISALEDNFLVPWSKSLSSTSFILGRAWESACSLSSPEVSNDGVSTQQDSYPRVLFSAMYSTISHLATKTIPGTLQSSVMLTELKTNIQNFEGFIRNLRKMSSCLKVCQSNPNVSDPILWLEEFRSTETNSPEDITVVSPADDLFHLITEELCSFADDSTISRELRVHKLALAIFRHVCALHWQQLPMRLFSSLKTY